MPPACGGVLLLPDLLNAVALEQWFFHLLSSVAAADERAATYSGQKRVLWGL